jgi:hypothetical protein
MGTKKSRGLHICPACGSDLVQPLDVAQLPPGSWCVELLCPNCWWNHHGVHDQAEVDRFDEELARGEAAILATIDELAESSMQDEIDRFARALAADAILPIDF